MLRERDWWDGGEPDQRLGFTIRVLDVTAGDGTETVVRMLPDNGRGLRIGRIEL